ncbi:hypothetical protein HN51_011770 [Arachis hypogaea]|uniref:Serine/arginine-rich splicing factor SR45 isoform X1 n=1 Tax=Arachis duranensis TaxID=130453 RepID=A0A6P4CPH8_ARADU|nr:serine/arginine-rich splicing factor SR45 isoform X1 [Arachis duranensis]XP_025688326.1 serine/arginine-rich splicing factor SR45 [Arachis hypogaea]XP_057749698.1 serine/arginine-rich splicing factor SR45 isoform X1 [Arachis stenosperma]QHO57127.1 TATA-binding protein-associated factor 2N [Arachis hypogaea]
MASRENNEEAPPHQHHQQPPLLSSLVVRPSTNTTDASPSPDRHRHRDRDRDRDRDPPPPPLHSRSARFPHDPPGHRTHAGSASPVRRSDADHRYGSDYDNLSRNRGYGNAREAGRYRDPSPPYGRGRVGGRPVGRAFDRPGFNPGLLRGDNVSRNNPNVRPREGDWFCPDPRCGNLNFARRDHCNSCNRPRFASGASPRRAYPGPPPLHAPPRRLPGPSIARSPERAMNGYRSPPRGFARDAPKEYLPPLRHEGRFPDSPHARRERIDYIEDSYRGRNRFDRSPPLDFGPRRPARDDFSGERKVFDRRLPSPPPSAPLLPHRGPWARDVRERSRSPIRGAPPPKDYRQDMYLDRVRDDRRGVGRDKIRGMY